MDSTTRNALAAINRRFYSHLASEFDASRAHPWPGWTQLLDHAPAFETAPRVLDVGCGNGRFGAWLAEHLGLPLDYLGLDGEPALLRSAEQRLGALAGDLRLVHFDLAADASDAAPESELDALLDHRRFDWIALFAVLHHLPGEARRRALVRRLAARLAPGGILTLSYWLFDNAAEWRAKTVPWSAVRHLVDPAQLEEGDHLLRWDGRPDPPRYCHLPSDAEIDRLLAAVETPCVARFRADGRDRASNLYLAFRRPHFPSSGEGC